MRALEVTDLLYLTLSWRKRYLASAVIAVAAVLAVETTAGRRWYRN